MNELPDCMYDYRDDLAYRYERDDEPVVAGACVECGETIYEHQTHYIFNKIDCVCKDCINEYVDQFKIEPLF